MTQCSSIVAVVVLKFVGCFDPDADESVVQNVSPQLMILIRFFDTMRRRFKVGGRQCHFEVVDMVPLKIAVQPMAAGLQYQFTHMCYHHTTGTNGRLMESIAGTRSGERLSHRRDDSWFSGKSVLECTRELAVRYNIDIMSRRTICLPTPFAILLRRRLDEWHHICLPFPCEGGRLGHFVNIGTLRDVIGVAIPPCQQPGSRHNNDNDGASREPVSMEDIARALRCALGKASNLSVDDTRYYANILRQLDQVGTGDSTITTEIVKHKWQLCFS